MSGLSLFLFQLLDLRSPNTGLRLTHFPRMCFVSREISEIYIVIVNTLNKISPYTHTGARHVTCAPSARKEALVIVRFFAQQRLQSITCYSQH